MLNGVIPFFIVDNLQESLDFYRAKLGFEVKYTGGGDERSHDYWGMVARDNVMLLLKRIASDVHPLPNSSRHAWAGWDVYINAADPDVLYREYADRGVAFRRELGDTSDGLRAFEIVDNSGYVLCFGCPSEIVEA